MRIVVPLYMKLVGLAIVVLIVAIAAVAETIQARSFTTTGNLAVARKVSSLVRMSEVIIAGTVRAEAGTRNLARNPKDISREDPNMVVLGQDYVVDVDSVIKGASIDRTITVSTTRSTSVQKGLLRGERASDMFIPLRVGTRYVLLLSKIRWAPGVYSTPIEPNRFALGAGATVESNWREARQLFPPISTEAFIAALRAEVAAEPR